MRRGTVKVISGFTLIEMLVAIAIMAVMAGLSWRGLDAMATSKTHNDAYRQQVLALQAGLAQWGADWDAMMQPSLQTPLEATATSLRFVRQAPAQGPVDAGLVVVAYAQQPTDSQASTSTWVRWQSQPVTQHAGLANAWKQSTTWLESMSQAPTPHDDSPDRDGGKSVTLATINNWKTQFFVNNQWQDTPPPTSFVSAIAPFDAVRLHLELTHGQALTGLITRDWIVPSAGGTR